MEFGLNHKILCSSFLPFFFGIPFFFSFFLCVCRAQSAIEISALTASVAVCGYAFGQINQLAGLLFIPYVAWCGYATYLNWSIYKKNGKPFAAKIAASKSDWCLNAEMMNSIHNTHNTHNTHNKRNGKICLIA